jgi:DNA polymerase III epsilon subunit-like protein
MRSRRRHTIGSCLDELIAIRDIRRAAAGVPPRGSSLLRGAGHDEIAQSEYAVTHHRSCLDAVATAAIWERALACHSRAMRGRVQSSWTPGESGGCDCADLRYCLPTREWRERAPSCGHQLLENTSNAPAGRRNQTSLHINSPEKGGADRLTFRNPLRVLGSPRSRYRSNEQNSPSHSRLSGVLGIRRALLLESGSRRGRSWE